MTVDISSDAEEELIEGYWFHERQSAGLGDYFRSCLIADMANAEVVIREWIETARELGRSIPEPRGRLMYA